jgi:hypothetical protein
VAYASSATPIGGVSFPRLFHERGLERATSRFHAPPGVGQNVAWALTDGVNFTRIIDDLWYRDISAIDPEFLHDFTQVSAAGRRCLPSVSCCRRTSGFRATVNAVGEIRFRGKRFDQISRQHSLLFQCLFGIYEQRHA